MNAKPISPAEFRATLDPLLQSLEAQGEGMLALAISGGSDSMGLLRLAHDAYPGRVTAVTVDHGLREASAREAAQVGAWCKALGISHHVLRWEGAKPSTGLQRRAREARYALLAQAAIALGMGRLAAPLVVAHTLDDQAETFLLRLAHGSDIGGLGAMRAASEIAGAPPVPLLRPLLGLSRERLRATLDAVGQSWFNDPSNEDTRFERVRLRRVMPELAGAGLDSEAFARASRLMVRIDRMLLGSSLAACVCQIAPEGLLSFKASAFATLPIEAGVRLLSHALRLVGGEPYPPARASLISLARQISEFTTRGATLGGCQLYSDRGDWIVEREARSAGRAPAIPLADGGTALWDNRFWVRIPPGFGPATIRARGNLPAIFDREGRIEVPLLVRDADGFREMRYVPAAFFAGEARMNGSALSLWRRVMKDTSPMECEAATVS